MDEEGEGSCGCEGEVYQSCSSGLFYCNFQKAKGTWYNSSPIGNKSETEFGC